MGNYVVYKHTNNVNGRVYIGITCQKPEKRWKDGLGYETNQYFSRAIKKYGWENFSHDILYSGLEKQDAQTHEINLILFYRNSEVGCYNILSGGDLGRVGVPMSAETKEKLRKAKLGWKMTDEQRKRLSEARVGKKMSAEVRQKMSENNARYWQGKKRSLETNEKIRQANLGRKHTPETKAKMSVSSKGKKRKNPFTPEHLEAISRSTRKSVLQMDLEGNPIREWESMRAAADFLNKKYINLISKCCRGLISSAYGYRWKIINNEGE